MGLETPTYDVRVWRTAHWWRPWGYSYTLHLPGGPPAPDKPIGAVQGRPMGRAWSEEAAYVAARRDACVAAAAYKRLVEPVRYSKQGLSACPVHRHPGQIPYDDTEPCTCVRPRARPTSDESPFNEPVFEKVLRQ